MVIIKLKTYLIIIIKKNVFLTTMAFKKYFIFKIISLNKIDLHMLACIRFYLYLFDMAFVFYFYGNSLKKKKNSYCLQSIFTDHIKKSCSLSILLLKNRRKNFVTFFCVF